MIKITFILKKHCHSFAHPAHVR